MYASKNYYMYIYTYISSTQVNSVYLASMYARYKLWSDFSYIEYLLYVEICICVETISKMSSEIYLQSAII